MKRRRYAENNRTELIVRTGKSEAEVIANKKPRLRYCTVEANYWQTRNTARPLCDSRVSCMEKCSQFDDGIIRQSDATVVYPFTKQTFGAQTVTDIGFPSWELALSIRSFLTTSRELCYIAL